MTVGLCTLDSYEEVAVGDAPRVDVDILYLYVDRTVDGFYLNVSDDFTQLHICICSVSLLVQLQ